MFNVTSQPLITLKLTLTIKRVFNVGPKTLTLILIYKRNAPKKTADCGFRISVRVSRLSLTLTGTTRLRHWKVFLKTQATSRMHAYARACMWAIKTLSLFNPRDDK